MALRKGVSPEEVARLRQRVNALLDQLSRPEGDEARAPEPGYWTPAVDVLETAEAFLLSAELPGVRREEMELEVHGRRLELSGTRALEDARSYLRLEGRYGPFRRSLDLPGDVDAAGISAQLERGVLAITLPKRRARRVTVGGDQEVQEKQRGQRQPEGKG